MERPKPFAGILHRLDGPLGVILVISGVVLWSNNGITARLDSIESRLERVEGQLDLILQSMLANNSSTDSQETNGDKPATL
ncbi:MAG: hypothetical protein F4Z71_14215 [Gammaproteobacteria bacterium]|nr:hypothetical protein [Gammaproteobacteria bacterium]MYE29414.1 hypothetical protein [Gammaproteobacteria bacterium]